MTRRMIVRTAEAEWRRGLYLDSWETLDELEPIERALPDVIALRCRICIAMERWELGHELAQALSATDEEHHITAAEFFAAYAHELAERGNDGAGGQNAYYWVSTLHFRVPFGRFTFC